MRIKIFDSDSKFKLWQWHTWFAWRPVFVGDDLVWLEKIARKRTGSTLPAFYWEYKYLSETQTLDNLKDDTMNTIDPDTDFFYYIREKSTGRFLSHKCIDYVTSDPNVHVYSLIDIDLSLSDNESQLPLCFFFKDEAIHGLKAIKEHGFLPKGTDINNYEIVKGKC